MLAVFLQYCNYTSGLYYAFASWSFSTCGLVTFACLTMNATFLDWRHNNDRLLPKIFITEPGDWLNYAASRRVERRATIQTSARPVEKRLSIPHAFLCFGLTQNHQPIRIHGDNTQYNNQSISSPFYEAFETSSETSSSGWMPCTCVYIGLTSEKENIKLG